MKIGRNPCAVHGWIGVATTAMLGLALTVQAGEKIQFSEPGTRDTITTRPSASPLENMGTSPAAGLGTSRATTTPLLNMPSTANSRRGNTSDRDQFEKDWIFQDTSSVESLRRALGVGTDGAENASGPAVGSPSVDPVQDYLNRQRSRNAPSEDSSSLFGSFENNGFGGQSAESENAGTLSSGSGSAFLSGSRLGSSQGRSMFDTSNPLMRKRIERLSGSGSQTATTSALQGNPTFEPQQDEREQTLERLRALEAMKPPETPSIGSELPFAARLGFERVEERQPRNSTLEELRRIQVNQNGRRVFPSRRQ